MVTNNIAFCETNGVDQPYETSQLFRMFFDGYEEKNMDVTFQYLPDPTIDSIKPLRSFVRCVGV